MAAEVNDKTSLQALEQESSSRQKLVEKVGDDRALMRGEQYPKEEALGFI